MIKYRFPFKPAYFGKCNVVLEWRFYSHGNKGMFWWSVGGKYIICLLLYYVFALNFNWLTNQFNNCFCQTSRQYINQTTEFKTLFTSNICIILKTLTHIILFRNFIFILSKCIVHCSSNTSPFDHCLFKALSRVSIQVKYLSESTNKD